MADTNRGDVGPGRAKRKTFIVGAARSGTTWVRSILAEHDDVVSGPESHLFPVLFGALCEGDPKTRREHVLEAFDRRAAHREAVARHRPQGPHRWADRDTIERLLAEAEADGLTGENAARFVIDGILEEFFARNGGSDSSVLVEKTPVHLRSADRILEWWPEARIIEVVRDGRDVCVSLAHKSKVVSWAPADRQQQIRLWTDAVRRGIELRSAPQAEDRWLLARYEDLTADPHREVRRLFEFCGLPADDAAIAGVVERTAFENAKSRRPGDNHHLRKGRVGGWRDEFGQEDRAEFDLLAGDLLTALGYER